MTVFRVRLPDCSTIEIACVELTTRADGSLWLLAASDTAERGRPSALPKLRPVLVLGRGKWVAAWPADGPDPFAAPAEQQPEPRPARLSLQCEDVPDPLGRGPVIASRLADLDEPDT